MRRYDNVECSCRLDHLRPALAPANPRAGFTLIELVVVIAILGLMMGIVFVGLQGFGRKAGLDSTARLLASTAKIARSHAAARGVRCEILYDLRSNEFWITIPVTPAPETSDEEVEEDEETEDKWLRRRPDDMEERQILFKREFSRGVFFEDVTVGKREVATDGLVTISVSPKGYMDRHMIHIINTDEQQATISINSLTGDVEVFNSYVDPD